MNTRSTIHSLMVALAAAALVSGCVRYQSTDGVENTWHSFSPDQFKPGTTTQAEVLHELGPPSQVIAQGDNTIFYYLSQRRSGTAKVFIVWNVSEDRTRYDRAVFFFDASGVLTEFAIRDETGASE